METELSGFNLTVKGLPIHGNLPIYEGVGKGERS